MPGHREPRLVRRLQQDARGLPFIRIPKTLATALGWERGDEIEIRLTSRGTLELRKRSGGRRGIEERSRN